MSTEATELSKSTLPAHLQVARSELTSLDTVSDYFTPPILKIIQDASDKAWKDEFNIGDAVLSPQRQLICANPLLENGKPSETGGTFHITPIFMYNEYIAWNPIKLRGQLQAIRERTFDRNSEVASKCLNFDSNTMPCPENIKEEVKFREHLNFITVLNVPEGDLMYMMPILISFSSTQHKKGRHLCQLAKMRGHELFGGVYAMRTGYEKNAFNDWYGWTISNPNDGVVSGHVEDPTLYEAYRTMHDDLKTKHAEGLISSDYGSDEESFGGNEATVVTDSKDSEF